MVRADAGSYRHKHPELQSAQKLRLKHPGKDLVKKEKRQRISPQSANQIKPDERPNAIFLFQCWSDHVQRIHIETDMKKRTMQKNRCDQPPELALNDQLVDLFAQCQEANQNLKSSGEILKQEKSNRYTNNDVGNINIFFHLFGRCGFRSKFSAVWLFDVPR